ncbi:alkaline phosphatase family protein [Streptomyces sp. SPB78]|uniref:alkaline phosphatase family protein n=1 Tax=Streptomyces sp. (strain SPB78) TaxID=591157 RepID=UPI0001B549EB
MSRARHVLVVGIDGVRLDTLTRASTPHLDTVARAGFLTPVTVADDTPTMSGPCWATVVTGVRIAKHAVWSNDFSGHRLDVFPDFTTRLARQDGLRTYVAAAWEPLVTIADGGPMFRHPSRLSHHAPAADTPADWEDADEAIVRDAVQVLTHEDPAASFVYLGAPDETAHHLGCGDAYQRSVEAADRRLGLLLASCAPGPRTTRRRGPSSSSPTTGTATRAATAATAHRSARRGWPRRARTSRRAPGRPGRCGTRTWPLRCTRRSAVPPTRTGRSTAPSCRRCRGRSCSTWMAPSWTRSPSGSVPPVTWPLPVATP